MLHHKLILHKKTNEKNLGNKIELLHYKLVVQNYKYSGKREEAVFAVEKMEKGKGDYKAHCLALPYILQSHINPLLQFSKRLQHKGIKITPALTHFTAKTLHGETCSIAVDTVSDGYDEGGSSESESIEAYLTRFKLVGSETLALLIDKLRRLDNPVDCVVYDASLPWALDVVKAFSLVGARFSLKLAPLTTYTIICTKDVLIFLSWG